MDHWWARQNVDLGGLEKDAVEDYTGRIPLLLEKCVENGKINLGTNYLDDIFVQARSFEKDLRLRYHKNEGELRRYILQPFYPHNFANVCRHYEYMKACVFGLPVSTSWKHIRDLVDHRYFYDHFDPKLGRVGNFSCGLARNAAAEILLANNVVFTGVDFLKPLPKHIDNPSVVEFMIEKAVLSSISLYGLNAAKETNGSMIVKSYLGGIQSLYPEMGDLVLHLPGSFNFKTIDGVIVRKAGPKNDNTKNQLFVFPLQVTVSKKHKDSHATFFKEWKQWIQDLKEFDVVPEFIWISEKGADVITHDESSKWPAHLERNISLHTVNVYIGNLYDAAKKGQRIQNGVPLNEDFE